MHVVRSRILFLLSGKLSSEIKSPEGKLKLQEQILEVTREAVDTEAAAEIDNVHFSIFVVQ
jgi:flagellar basal body-associated protein FliL